MKQNQTFPRVSVVIPTYRRPVELKRALESVLTQDFTNIEVLVVDDNPPGTPGREDTTRLLESLEGPLVYIRTEGSLGGAGARNVGIEAARGEYVAFLDDDDQWLPGKLRRQMELMESLPLSVCSVDTGFFEIDETRGTKKQVKPALRGKIFDELLVKHKGRAPKLSSMLCRTRALREIGGFDASLPARQDLDLYLRLARNYSFEFIEDPLVIKYVHENDRITANVTSKIRAFDLFYQKYRPDFLTRPRLHRIFLRKQALWLLYDRRFLKGTAQLMKSIFLLS